ncbi:MAG: nucleotide exchange factor GrpE [Rhodospirillales bacterium]|nr:nucleotide exchange factor GrpE [Rhodospirillales bacterium]
MSDKTDTTETEEPAPEENVAESGDGAENVPDESPSEDETSDDGRPENEAGDTNAAPATPEEQIAGLEAEVASLNDRLLRAMAETENIRRRAQRDKQDTAKYAIANFARDMLSVADNLGRALGSVDESARKDNGSLENLMIGVEMTERVLMAAMGRVGVSRMEPLGTRFDPNVHEAMFEYDDPSQLAGTVGQLIEPGYMMHDRPLRPAKVGITKGGAKPDPAQKESSDADPSSEAAGATAYDPTGDKPGSQIDEEL